MDSREPSPNPFQVQEPEPVTPTRRELSLLKLSSPSASSSSSDTVVGGAPINSPPPLLPAMIFPPERPPKSAIIRRRRSVPQVPTLPYNPHHFPGRSRRRLRDAPGDYNIISRITSLKKDQQDPYHLPSFSISVPQPSNPSNLSTLSIDLTSLHHLQNHCHPHLSTNYSTSEKAHMQTEWTHLVSKAADDFKALITCGECFDVHAMGSETQELVRCLFQEMVEMEGWRVSGERVGRWVGRLRGAEERIVLEWVRVGERGRCKGGEGWLIDLTE